MAQDLEFSAHSMSTTTDGYEQRTKSRVDAVKMLKKREVWIDGDGGYGHDDDMDDARDILVVVRRLCRLGKNKGKGRSS